MFADDSYLQPVLEDDALLFYLDDITADESDRGEAAPTQKGQGLTRNQSDKVRELEAELSKIKSQFADYRLVVGKALDDRWNAVPNDPGSVSATEPQLLTVTESSSASNKMGNNSSNIPENSPDDSYFASYGHHEIHQTMLQDRVRTDAYRDFIYANKHLFAGATVLDIGCGTGILSLFCVRAGAARVIAVDNAAIIDKTREIVYANGAQDRITVVRGRIEDVVLPVAQVDIIVSEWMGYCLLYEAMLDSVLWARDRYLKKGGLMVPAQCTLRIASVVDPDWVAENVTFWRDVYGFEMETMMEKVLENVVIRRVEPENVVGKSVAFKVLPLHTIQKKELMYGEGFQMQLDRDIDALDGWLIWFDTFFLTSPNAEIMGDTLAEEWGSKGDGSNAFTTGPFGKETHWQSGFMAIDRTKKPGQPLKEGQQLIGSVAYMRREDNERELDISIWWDADGSTEKGTQCFIMR